jgi:ech hydrogenase subunit A
MWWSVPFLIIFPMVIGAILFCIRIQNVRKAIAYVATPAIILAVLDLAFKFFAGGATPVDLYFDTETADMFISAGEVILMLFVVIQCFRYKKYWISLLSIIPTGMILWLEYFGPKVQTQNHIRIDHLSVLMCIIVGVVGGLIAIYAMGYMDGYHHHHTEVPERRHYFFMVVYLFLGAMFGFVLSDSLMWVDFFWETTSVCSFMLIGYTQTDEAINNSFRALWMNLLGGLALAIGILYFAINTGSVSFRALTDGGIAGDVLTALPIALIAFAALTKSAQLPFSTWLMGAMVAPTPSSALLHSATMVKAGIYVLFRLAPAMYGTTTGAIVATIGGFTFLMTSIMAIAQTDAKKVLALSTVSNLGLMVACAGIGSPSTIWAGVFLMIFHSVSKSLLFQDVGATENSLFSRDIEDMHGLLYRLPKLASFMFIGIVGMYLAPFGMLVSKWAALRASVDNKGILLVLFIVFGSALTSFYWTKWLGKLIGRTATNMKVNDITKGNEMFSLTCNAVMMFLLCLLFPLLSRSFVDPLVESLYGNYHDAIPMDVLYILSVCVLVVFAVPFITYFTTKDMPYDQKLAYMGGINMDNDNCFTDSYGNPKKLWLTNYYFAHKIGQRKLMLPSQLAATAALVIMFCLVVGGVL